jgi:hypothetical protein
VWTYLLNQASVTLQPPSDLLTDTLGTLIRFLDLFSALSATTLGSADD